VCLENPKSYTKRVLELIIKLSKLAGYKNQCQKSVSFLFTNNELFKKAIKKTIPSTIAFKLKKKVPRKSKAKKRKKVLRK
jgi:ABC-type sulfate/molybdate transport systems ATPase subunit